jgi:hypothetical protein
MFEAVRKISNFHEQKYSWEASSRFSIQEISSLFERRQFITLSTGLSFVQINPLPTHSFYLYNNYSDIIPYLPLGIAPSSFFRHFIVFRLVYDMIWYDIFVNCNWIVTPWQ